MCPDEVDLGRSPRLTTGLPRTPSIAARVPRWLRWLLGVLLLALVAAMAVARAGHQRAGTDFWVFWTAGCNFAHGLPLYGDGAANRRLIYPPFAAQVFQIFSLFPLKVAAALFYVVSIGLWAAAAWLTRDIVRRLRPDAPSRSLPLVLAVALSAQFVLNNLNLLQMNLLTLAMCLVGVRGLIRGRPHAMAWLVGAAWLKITPVFLVVWGVVRGGRRAFITALGTSAACLVLPIVQRGPTQGLADLGAYYHTFLGGFASGQVVTTYTNQNLAALVYRAVTPSKATDQYHYEYLPSLRAFAPILYRTLAGLVLAGFAVRLAFLAWRRVPVTPLELAGVFLTGHLVSGITWKAHLVTMLFVFYAMFSLDWRALSRGRRWVLGLAWLGIAVAGLVGRDVFGERVHRYMGGYSIFVWVMLWLWVTCASLESGGSPGGLAADSHPLR